MLVKSLLSRAGVHTFVQTKSHEQAHGEKEKALEKAGEELVASIHNVTEINPR